MTRQTAPVKSVDSARAPMAKETGASPSLRTQTYTVKGQDKHGAWREMRVTAPSSDYAKYIAHQRGMSVAECEVSEQPPT